MRPTQHNKKLSDTKAYRKTQRIKIIKLSNIDMLNIFNFFFNWESLKTSPVQNCSNFKFSNHT